jgi:hypothetical protein
VAGGQFPLAAMTQIAQGDRRRRGGPGIEIVRVVIRGADPVYMSCRFAGVQAISSIYR